MTAMPLYGMPIDSVEDARAWLRLAVDHIGGAFHWDTFAEDYEDATLGPLPLPVFDAESAEQFDEQAGKAYVVLCEAELDPYAEALPLVNAWLEWRATDHDLR